MLPDAHHNGQSLYYDFALEQHERAVAVEKERRNLNNSRAMRGAARQMAKATSILSKHEGGKTVINNVTINLSDGSSFTGPLAVGEDIKISYQAIRN